MDDPIIMSSSPLKTASSVAAAPSKNVATAMTAYVAKYCEIATGNRVVFQGMHAFALNNGGWYRFKCKTCQDNWNMKTDLFQGMNAACPKELTDWLDLHKHICTKFTTYGQAYGTNPKCHNCSWAWNQHKAAQPIFDIETGTWHAQNPPQAQGPVGMPGPVGQQGPTIAPIHYDKGHIAEVKKGTPFIKHVMVDGTVIQINPSTSEVVVPLYKGRSTGVRDCIVCHEVIAVASGSGICQTCFTAAKTVHENKAVTVTKTEGRMFRHKEGTCESQVTPTTTSNDSAN